MIPAARAIRRARWAMDEFIVEGIKTTLPLQKMLIESDTFRDVTYHTRYIDEWLKERHDER